MTRNGDRLLVGCSVGSWSAEGKEVRRTDRKASSMYSSPFSKFEVSRFSPIPSTTFRIINPSTVT